MSSMNKFVKTRLCWNCEGSVAVTAETCPYCGVSVVPASLDGTPANFAPPYRIGSNESSIPRSPYASQQEAQKPEEVEIGQPADKSSEAPLDDFKRVFWALVLLLSGSVFFLFGLVLVLFSTDGVFTLRWDGTLWFIYSLVSIPMLLLGWKAFSKLDST
jgi:hypothetical protein